MLVVFFSFNSIWIELYVSGSTVSCGTDAVAPHAVLLAFLSTFLSTYLSRLFPCPSPGLQELLLVPRPAVKPMPAVQRPLEAALTGPLMHISWMNDLKIPVCSRFPTPLLVLPTNETHLT